MTAPAASMMPGRLSTAARVSIFAISRGPRGCGSVPTRRMSWAERTKLMAIMSTPTSTNASRARKSSSVGVAICSRSDGTWMPGSAPEAAAVDDGRQHLLGGLLGDLEHGAAVADREAVAELYVGRARPS